MTTYTNAPARPVGLPGLTNVKGAVQDMLRRWSQAQAKRREADQVYRELQAYSDRQLHDLGLDRSDIAAVASGTYMRG